MTTATATPRLARAANNPMPRRKAQVTDIIINSQCSVGDWQYIGFDFWEESITEAEANALVLKHGFGVAEKMTLENMVD